ncbi:MAG: PglZ domain-containing protein [bacterium]|nr:PglZ domain-containing protein [bacterium]
MNLHRQRVLWIDDQIDRLKPHILFLEEKGYSVTGVSNGDDGISLVESEVFDVLLLDEMMPGKNGIETLIEVRGIKQDLPIIMITKSEEEDLMNKALGHSVQDFLVKPVNPVQIFSAIKRLFEGRKVQESQLTQDYISNYTEVSNENMEKAHWRRWFEVNRFLVDWDIRFDRFEGTGLEQTHHDLHRDLNLAFGRYIEANYPDWVCGTDVDRPLLSPEVFKHYASPYLESGRQIFFIIIDCMRFDQWRVVEEMLKPYFQIKTEEYLGILPSATPYARNALFSGLFPDEMAEQYPDFWLEDPHEETSLNRYEKHFFTEQMGRLGFANLTSKYAKVSHINEANELFRQIGSFQNIPVVSLVFNFIDILAHGRSQSEILQEIAPDEAAFRSLMGSWFRHSALFDILKTLSRQGSTVIITSDHGSVLCRKSSLVYGNRDTSSGIRYKYGDNLGCDVKQAIKVVNPADYRLPASSRTKNYILARENHYFVYPTNFHEYEQRYFNSFQHGGLSMEELIIPCAILDPKP